MSPSSGPSVIVADREGITMREYGGEVGGGEGKQIFTLICVRCIRQTYTSVLALQ